MTFNNLCKQIIKKTAELSRKLVLPIDIEVDEVAVRL